MNRKGDSIALKGGVPLFLAVLGAWLWLAEGRWIIGWVLLIAACLLFLAANQS